MVFLTTKGKQASLIAAHYTSCAFGVTVLKRGPAGLSVFSAHFWPKEMFPSLGTSLVFLTPAQSERGRRAKYRTGSSGQLRLGRKRSKTTSEEGDEQKSLSEYDQRDQGLSMNFAFGETQALTCLFVTGVSQIICFFA